MKRNLDLANPPDLDLWGAQIHECYVVSLLANDDGMDHIASSHIGIARALLVQAEHHISLASLAQARGIAER